MSMKFLLRFDTWAVALFLAYLAAVESSGTGLQCILTNKCFSLFGMLLYTRTMLESLLGFFVPVHVSNIILAVYTFLPVNLDKVREVLSLAVIVCFIAMCIFLERDLAKLQYSPLKKTLLNFVILFVTTFVFNIVTVHHWEPVDNLQNYPSVWGRTGTELY